MLLQGIRQATFPAGASDQGKTALHILASKGLIGPIKILLEFGADANSQDQSGNIPLHTSSELGHFKIVQVLLEAGSDAAITNSNNETSLVKAMIFSIGEEYRSSIPLINEILKSSPIKLLKLNLIKGFPRDCPASTKVKIDEARKILDSITTTASKSLKGLSSLVLISKNIDYNNHPKIPLEVKEYFRGFDYRECFDNNHHYSASR